MLLALTLASALAGETPAATAPASRRCSRRRCPSNGCSCGAWTRSGTASRPWGRARCGRCPSCPRAPTGTTPRPRPCAPSPTPEGPHAWTTVARDELRAALVPEGLTGSIAAGPLVHGDALIGFLVVQGRQPLDAHVDFVQDLLEPLGVALENDTRLHELARLREAVEAENRALLSRLGRHDLSDSIVGREADLSAVTPGKFFIRFGVCYQGTGAGAGRGTVALQTSFDACGKIVGSHSFQAYAENANDYYQPVTGWIPTIHVDKVKAAIIVSGVQVSGVTFDYNLAFQTAATSPEGPDAWSSTFLSGNTLQSGAAEWASGELSWASAPTNKMWVRYGVHYKSSGASRAGAFVSAAVAVRK